MRAPDGIEPIVAWRYWRVEESALHSLTRSVLWLPGTAFEARCRLSTRHGPVPSPACHCGVYAAKDLHTLQTMTTPSLQLPLAVGKVALWGRVIPAERGYRAQYAYPKRLWLVWESLDLLARPGAQRVGVAAAYGVPAQFCDAGWALSQECPDTSVELPGRPGPQVGCRRSSLKRFASMLGASRSERVR